MALTVGQKTARDSEQTTPPGMTKSNKVVAKMFLQCSYGFSITASPGKGTFQLQST